MGSGLRRLRRRDLPTVPVTLQTAGIDGAGGAGFPAYAKWDRLEEVRWLLVNHQESEPNYFIDKYLGRARAHAFAEFFESMLTRGVFEAIIVCAKEVDRPWLQDLERETKATVVEPADLPIPEADRQGVIIAYTDDRYEYGMESVLLRLVGDVTMGTKLPMDFGWLVQNTESLNNVIRALDDGTPVTEKYVHVDGDGAKHRFLLAPVGTTATTLLAAAGVDAATLDESTMLADGGPGWCFAIDGEPDAWGLRKRTNCLLVLDRATAAANTLGDERINVRKQYLERGDREYERSPTRLDPDRVLVPLISNPSLTGIVQPAVPVVEAGTEVTVGQLVAKPADEGFSTAVHASIDGVVTAVTVGHIEIRRPAEEGGATVLSEMAASSEAGRDVAGHADSVTDTVATAEEMPGETQSGDSRPGHSARNASQAAPGPGRQEPKSRLNRVESATVAARFLPAVYWTWCTGCGSYVAYPDLQDVADPTAYRCQDCVDEGTDRSRAPRRPTIPDSAEETTLERSDTATSELDSSAA